MSVLDLLSGDEPITDAAQPSASPQQPVDSSQNVNAQQASSQSVSAQQAPQNVPPPAPQRDSIAGMGSALPAPAPAPPKPENRWHAVLSGALNGLLMGGVPGAVVGAVAPQRVQEAQQAAKQFRNDRLQTADADAAIAMAHAAVAKAQLARLPDAVQNSIDDHGMQLAEFWAKQNFLPALVTDNTPESAYAGLQQLARMNGGQVPQHTEVRLAGKLVFYTPKTGNSDLDSLKTVNNLRTIEGLQPITQDDWQNPKFNKAKAAADASSVLAPNGDALNSNKIAGEIARRQIIRANYASTAPEDPQKADNLKQLAHEAEKRSGDCGRQGRRNTRKTDEGGHESLFWITAHRRANRGQRG